jgi:hypothetical protein
MGLTAALALIACGEPTQPDEEARPTLALASNTWIRRADMPSPRWRFAAASLTNAAGQSLIYTTGGNRADGVRMGTTQVYNVATNSWLRKADLPRAVYSMNGMG